MINLLKFWVNLIFINLIVNPILKLLNSKRRDNILLVIFTVILIIAVTYIMLIINLFYNFLL